MTAEQQQGPVWLLAKEAAERARCGVVEINRALNNGELRGYQRTKGGKWRIDAADVDAWVRGEPPPAPAIRSVS